MKRHRITARILATIGVVALVASARADVVTNVWINPNGGNWFDFNNVVSTNVEDEVEVVTTNVVYTNWQDGKNCISTNVAYIPLSSGATIGTHKDINGNDAVARLDGLVMLPAEPDGTMTNIWWVKNDGNSTFHTYTSSFGYFPFNVSDGTLVVGSNSAWVPEDKGPARKEGDGIIRISSFYRQLHSRREFQVAEGKLIPMTLDALFWTDVRVTDPAGQFVFTNFSSRVGVGSLRDDTGGTFDLAGNEVLMGATGPDALAVNITGTGGVTAVLSSLTVTNIQPNITYGAREGVLHLDSKTGYAQPFAKYDFETSLTADSSGYGRNLVASGAVTWIDDAGRGGKVAHFEGTSDSGGKLVATVAGQTELTGDTDYTVSLWAKTKAAPVANNYPTMISIGSKQLTSQLVQFRYKDKNCAKLLLGHWNTVGDFSDLPAPANPAEWHHYVIMRERQYVGVWCDGVQMFDKSDMKLELSLPATVQINLGWLAEAQERFFCGDIDDVAIYSYSVGRAGVARLFAGEEPFAAGSLPAAGEPLEIPEGTKLRTELNGRILLAGSPVIPATNIVCDGVRGALAMPSGGTLTLTGGGTYSGETIGSNALVKDGGGELKLTGAAKHTGGTEVKAGKLTLLSTATQPTIFGIYDFESDDPGFEWSRSNRRLSSQKEVTREWDASRGWVVRLPGTSTQKLEATINSPVLSGDTDYTVSVWAKPDSDAPNNATLVSVGKEGDFQEIVFRYQNAVSGGNFVLTHWGGTLDFTGIPTVANPAGAWHHYVAVRKGTTYTVYCDGVQKWTQTKAQALRIPQGKDVCIGRQVNKTDRQFKGLLDDVRIYAQALDESDVLRLYAGRDPVGTARGEAPDMFAHVPAPVLHYAFEDASNLGKDSAPGGAHLKKVGSGTLTQVDSPLGGKALKFGARLESSTFPEAIPSNGQPFTVSLWVQGSLLDDRTKVEELNAFHSPSFICWGNPTAATIGCMLSCDHHDHSWKSVRYYVRAEVGSAKDVVLENALAGLLLSERELRWHHLALVYDPVRGVNVYVDGEGVSGKNSSGAFNYDSCRDGGVFYLGAKSSAPGAPFRGCLDEVKVFDKAFNIPQVRAVMRADAGALRVLPADGAVAVDAGATLEVNGTDESFSSLTGAGTLDLASGRLAITSTNTFAGTLAGDGLLVLPAGAELTLGQNPTNFTGVFEMAGGALVLPEGVTSIPATFRPLTVDPVASAAYPGDVEILDGTALTVSAGAYGPFVSTSRKVIICGGGTVTLPSDKAVGTWVIGQGAEVVDNGTGALDTRWTVTNLAQSRLSRFATENGLFTCTVLEAGTLMIFR